MNESAFSVEPAGSSEDGPCACCGNQSRTVWGYVHRSGRAEAAYFVHWTLGRIPDHGAYFDLIVGKWGVSATPADRKVVAVAFRAAADGPQFMVIDATSRPAAQSAEVAAVALRRDEVIGTPLASEVFVMLDAIWIGDPRIAEISNSH